MLFSLTTAQRQLLIALCKEGQESKPTSAAFIKNKYSLSSASIVQRILSALLDRDILTSEAGRYSVYDYFLRFWMKREVGE